MPVVQARQSRRAPIAFVGEPIEGVARGTVAVGQEHASGYAEVLRCPGPPVQKSSHVHVRTVSGNASLSRWASRQSGTPEKVLDDERGGGWARLGEPEERAEVPRRCEAGYVEAGDA
jgi:hypothetical protein